MSATGRNDQRGFTLIEMLVVLAVLGLVSGIAFPAVERSITHQQFRLAVTEVETALRGARASAIAGDSRVNFAPEGTPEGVTLELPRGGLQFYPDGSASGGTVTVTGSARKVRFTVEAATGLIGQQQ